MSDFRAGKRTKCSCFWFRMQTLLTFHEKKEKMYWNPYSKFAMLHGMTEAYDFVHPTSVRRWTTDVK